MAPHQTSSLPDLLTRHEADLVAVWLRELASRGPARPDLISSEELRQQCGEVLRLYARAMAGEDPGAKGSAWDDLRGAITSISRSRARQGFSPSQSAEFVLALKRPLFDLLRRETADPSALAEEVWTVTETIDRLALVISESYMKGREEVIHRQQQEMLELSTPVVSLWDGVLALPLIGSLDSARTQVVMEQLLEAIVRTNSKVAILDITGVPTVDTLVAQHLLKTVSAARLMGAECIISGIRPQIAQTIIHLGLDLGQVTTKATLADAFSVALTRTGRKVVGA